MAAAGGEHPGDVARRAIAEPATSIDAEISSLAGRPADTETIDRLQLHAGRALGEIDGLADRGLGGGEIDHGAGLHAARDAYDRSR